MSRMDGANEFPQKETKVIINLAEQNEEEDYGVFAMRAV